MCGNRTCPLAWRDRLLLRALCHELCDETGKGLLEYRVEPAYIIFDVCTRLNVDPYDVLPPEIVNRIKEREHIRLWPTLSEAEEAELVDLAGIREPGLVDDVGRIREEQRINEYEMYHGPRPF